MAILLLNRSHKNNRPGKSMHFLYTKHTLATAIIQCYSHWVGDSGVWARLTCDWSTPFPTPIQRCWWPSLTCLPLECPRYPCRTESACIHGQSSCNQATRLLIVSSLVHAWIIVMLSCMVCLSQISQNCSIYRMQLPGCWRVQRNLATSLLCWNYSTCSLWRRLLSSRRYFLYIIHCMIRLQNIWEN